MDFHNFNLDCKSKEWFKRNKEIRTLCKLETMKNRNNELSNRDIFSLVDINTKELK